MQIIAHCRPLQESHWYIYLPCPNELPMALGKLVDHRAGSYPAFENAIRYEMDSSDIGHLESLDPVFRLVIFPKELLESLDGQERL